MVSTEESVGRGAGGDGVLAAVEDVLGSHPDVREVAAVLVGGKLAAAVVPVDFASGPELRDYAWARLGDERSPRMVALLSTLPRDARGALDRVELARTLAEDDPPSSTYTPPRTPLEEAVADVLAEVLGVPRVGIDDDFLELGGDSLRAIEAADLLERRAGVQVSLEKLFEAATVRTLVGGVPDP